MKAVLAAGMATALLVLLYKLTTEPDQAVLDEVHEPASGEAVGSSAAGRETAPRTGHEDARRKSEGVDILVLGEGGRKLVGARIEVGKLHLRTGPNGTVSVSEAFTRFSVVHPDYTPVVRTIKSQPDDRSPIVVQLYRTCSLVIRVLDRTGAVLSGVEATVTRGAVDPKTQAVGPEGDKDQVEIRRAALGAIYRKTSRSGASGDLTLRGLNPGSHRIFLAKTGYYMIPDPKKEISSATTELDVGENFREYRMGRLYYATAGFDFDSKLSDDIMRSFHLLSSGFPKGLTSLSPDMATLQRTAKEAVHEWLSKKGFDREWILIARESPMGPTPMMAVPSFVNSRLMWNKARRIPVTFRPLTELGIGSVERVVLRGSVATGRLRVRTPYEIRVVYMEGRSESFFGTRIRAKSEVQERLLPVGNYRIIPTSPLLDRRRRRRSFVISKNGLTEIDGLDETGFGWLSFSIVDLHGHPTTDYSLSVRRDNPVAFVSFGGGKGATFRVPCEPGRYTVGKRTSAFGPLGTSSHLVETGKQTDLLLEMKK